jgi:DNA (cytosine-5)-methyltransferase 1
MKEKTIQGIYDFLIANRNQFSSDLEDANVTGAVITHYAQTQDNAVSHVFENSAIGLIETYLSQINEKVLDEDVTHMLQLFKAEALNVPFPPPKDNLFTFIDLFAGIGGFRLAMQNIGGKCVFSSEWDKEAQKTYRANFGEVPFGDITKEKTKSFIPDGFDILCAGFPCQAFSIAGKRGGFEDTRGTLFFEVADIIKKHKPRAIFLENVKGLRNHDKGKTLGTILNVLRDDLGYFVPEPQILNAKDFGVPQNRERIFIVGFRNDLNINEFEYPKSIEKKVQFKDIKEKQVVPTKYYISTQYLSTLHAHRDRHASKGNGFGFEIIPDEGIANAVVCGGMGRERNLVIDDRITDFNPETRIKGEVNKEGIRKMTPREWARLQGFPDEFKIPVADASAYKQFGNSVAVPAIQATGEKIGRILIIDKFKVLVDNLHLPKDALLSNTLHELYDFLMRNLKD